MGMESIDDECCSLFLNVLDRCYYHEAFTAAQKRCITCWKQNLFRYWKPTPKHRFRHATDGAKTFSAAGGGGGGGGGGRNHFAKPGGGQCGGAAVVMVIEDLYANLFFY